LDESCQLKSVQDRLAAGERAQTPLEFIGVTNGAQQDGDFRMQALAS
jgi:hypothetical protein